MSVCLADPPAPGRRYAGLPAGATAYFLSRLREVALVVVPELDEAERLVAELAWHGKPALLYPADDSRPYEGISPHPELPRRRIGVLAALHAKEEVTVVAPAASLQLRVLPGAALLSGPRLAPGVVIEPKILAQQLADLGYLGVGRVEDPGTFRLRGELVDLWPTGFEEPVRVEFFDDEVEALVTFDPETGRGNRPLSELHVLPAREEILGPGPLERMSDVLRERVGELGYGSRLRREVTEDLRDGLRFSGCDAWLPALHPLSTLFSVAPRAMLVLDAQGVEAALRRFEDQAFPRHAALPEAERPLVGPGERYLRADEVLAELDGATQIDTVAFDDAVDLGAAENTGLSVGASGDLAPTIARLGGWLADDWRVGLVVESTSRADRVRQLFMPHGLSPVACTEHDPLKWPTGRLQLLRGDLPRGFRDPEAQVALVTADEIFGARRRVRSGRQDLARKAGIESFADLAAGDLVVHERHGIGRFQSLARVDLGTGPQDMVLLEYRGGDRMYVPVFRLDQLYRYRASQGGVDPRLDKLGGETWSLRKARVKAAVLELAHGLVQLQARRKVNPGTAYDARSLALRRFEEAFEYTETEDQALAIDAVLDDLEKPEPMDRLIVGDAGFGKTEVAMRAAFVVASAGRQVAVLCPTTVLAFQHLTTFRERFEPFGITVGLLSRFGSPAEARELKKSTKEGRTSILVGTTRLLGRGLRFADLGLIVVDEEHRFGVKQKETLKKLRAEVDYLAMSATPIPRTLHMAVSGLRGISVISTPPRDRLPVRTLVARFSEGRLREEILRELQRGGQCFVVHNRIATIELVARAVREAVPEASVEIAHGRLDANTLEDVLVRFVRRRFDVLVCTAIIESGVDMPNVNTILVNRADGFGLAQLYQLRGRVGRSHRRGYCTLLVEDGRVLTRKAMQRLRVLQEHTRLGSGFAVATADLELRGAGDMLGDKQHGHIEAVGFEAYMSLLETAIAEARGDAERQRIEPEIEVRAPAWLPEAYVPDLQERLSIYKAMSSARSLEQLRRVCDVLESERGELPDEAHNLSRLFEVKLRCRELGIVRVSVLQVRAVFEVAENTSVRPERVVELAKQMPRRFRVSEGEIAVRFTPEESERPFLFLHWVFDLFGEGG
ncbi:MAG TPA: transcription-repair coupling factor [Myxococcota bacterium]|nr:transcription-repair coupling factor [Myxococcota bacterium]